MAQQPNRRGVILIALMVFLAVAMMIVISWLKLAGVERRQLRSLQSRAQAEWLAESALNRAAARIAADPTYRGETWKLDSADIGGRDAGEVLIRVEPVADSSNLKNVTVQADYPVDPAHRNRRTKTVVVAIPTAGGTS